MFVFPCFSRTMEIHFPHVLGPPQISAEYQKLKKPLTFKWLCFPIFFCYYGNYFSHILGFLLISAKPEIF